MSSQEKKIIVFLQRETLKSYLVDLKKATSKPGKEEAWTSENLAELLVRLKKEWEEKSIRVLLDDTLGYLLEFELPRDQKDEDEYLVKKISEKVREEIEKDDFEILEDETERNLRKIKIFAPVKKIWEIFSAGAKEAGLEIEIKETVSLALRRNKDPVLGLAKREVTDKKSEEINLPQVKLNQEGAEIDQGALLSAERVEKETSKPEKKPHLSRAFWLIFLGTLLVTVLFVGGILVYQDALKKSQILNSPIIPEETVNETIDKPVSEPTATLDISKLKIQVLNGSGVPGEAGKVMSFLEGLGYKDIKTGNADSYNYQGMELSLKKSQQDFRVKLVEDLSEKYTLSETLKNLDEEGEFDAVIILGKQ